jgi:Carboxypeptidase regulatory-like domain
VVSRSADEATPARGPDALDAGWTPEGAAAPPGGERSAKDLAWLVTPAESLGMMRASQLGLRGAGSAAARPPAPPVPRAIPTDPPSAPRHSPISGHLADAALPPPPPPPPVVARFAPSRAEVRHPSSAVHVVPPPGKQTVPLRQILVAAGITGVAFLGFLAGHLGTSRSPTAAASASRQEGAAKPPGPRVDARQSAPAPAPRRLAEAPAAAASAAPRERPPAPAERARRTPAVPAATVAERSEAAARPAPHAPPQAAPAPAAQVEAPAPPAAPTTAVVRGEVRDGAGHAVAGAKVSVRGTSLTAVSDGSGSFEIQDVPGGDVTLEASAAGYQVGSAQLTAQAGSTATATLTLVRPVTALEPDSELAAGGWIRVSRGEAASVLGGTLGVVPGLSIETVAQSAAGNRPRIRVAQLTPAGVRIVLTETRAGADVRGGPGPAVVTALRVMPASEAYPWSTGTVSFGNILITVKTHLAADTLRSFLSRLSEAPALPS